MDKLQKALAAELERTRQELRPDLAGYQQGLRTFRQRSWLLSRQLLLPMRRGLTEEAKDVFRRAGPNTLCPGWSRCSFEKTPIRRAIAAPGSTLKRSCLNREMQSRQSWCPGDDEVETAAIELAQLLLSNWTGFMQFQSPEGQREATAALHEKPPRVPPELFTGCAAYPVTLEECIATMASFLVNEEHLRDDDDTNAGA